MLIRRAGVLGGGGGCRVAGRNRYQAVWIAHAVTALLVGPAFAGGRAVSPPPLKLPADAVYDATVGPDSAVVFRHASHFGLAGNRCTSCHPAVFRILGPTRGISHRAMDGGAFCGSCHDGEHAFGVRDRGSCETCHVGRRATVVTGLDRVASAPGGSRRSQGPRPITYARGESSPGAVTFRHATHVGGKAGCANCHPQPFAMRSSGARPGGGMHDPSACAYCHDGGKAFAVTDENACTRCHREPGGAP